MSRKIRNEDLGKLTVPEFTFNEMVEHPSIVMVAKRGSGKSWVARAILDYFRDIPVGLIIAPTDRMNCFYGNYFPSSFIHYQYKTKIIERLLSRQISIIKKKKDKLQEKNILTQGHLLLWMIVSGKKMHGYEMHPSKNFFLMGAIIKLCIY